MDPLSALTIASSVVQFVDFATGLISKWWEIYHSSTGTFSDNEHLKDVIKQLRELSTTLSSPSSPSKLPESIASIPLSHMAGVQSLSSACKDDCDTLIEVLDGLEIEDGKRRLGRSLKAALKNRMNEAGISSLKSRIETRQRAISLHIGAIISDQAQRLTLSMENLSNSNQKHHYDQASRIESIAGKLDQLVDKALAFTHPIPTSPTSHETAEMLKRTFTAEDLEKISQTLTEVLSSRSKISREQTILASLNFRTRSDRQTAIAEAHADSFNWALENKFGEWLRHRDGIFWVSGKAGSGKSTLMKFIIDHPSTRSFLAEWAAPGTTGIVSHYFWSAGTAMQKSLQGLLRTLLFEIFRQHPSTLPIGTPLRFEVTDGNLADNPWTMAELRETIRRLANTNNLGVRFCCFIDGLDEYTGDHADFCEFLQSISRSPNIKLCLSSRPWTAFEAAFGDIPDRKIYLHEHTRADIRAFALDRLQTHRGWARYALQYGEKSALVDDIAERAQGVFLWVFLVTRSLRDGLTNEDTICDLRQRLESLPTELERLFKHMLEGVNSIYHSRMAGSLRIALEAGEPLQTEIYDFYNNEHEDPGFTISLPVRVPTQGLAREIQRRTRIRVDARTRGLLEVNEGHVQFLHRTVHDFLRTGDMIDYLESKSSSNFHPKLSLFKAYIALIKTTPFQDGVIRLPFEQPEGDFPQMLRTAFIYFHGLETTGQDVFKLLDELERTMVEIFSNQQATFHSYPCHPRLLFREMVIQEDLSDYLLDKLETDLCYLDLFDSPPLIIATVGNSVATSTRALLQFGQDPNQLLKDNNGCPNHEFTTVWGEISRLLSIWRNPIYGDFNHLLEDGFFLTFVSKGADPNVNTVGGDSFSFTAFADLLMACFSSILQDTSFGAYLRTLDTFLDAGAYLTARVELRNSFYSTNQTYHSVCWWPQPDNESTTIAAYCKGLRNIRSRNALGNRLALLRQVTRRLILRCTAEECEQAGMTSAVSAAFSKHQAHLVLALTPGTNLDVPNSHIDLESRYHTVDKSKGGARDTPYEPDSEHDPDDQFSVQRRGNEDLGDTLEQTRGETSQVQMASESSQGVGSATEKNKQDKHVCFDQTEGEGVDILQPAKRRRTARRLVAK